MVNREYNGKKYPKEIKSKNDFDKACRWLVKQGPFESALEHNAPCSIGETVEAIFGLPPSQKRIDLELPDVSIELKSGRISASNPKSEATSTIQFDDGPYSGKSNTDGMRRFVKERGYTTESAAQLGVRTQKDYKGRINLYHAVDDTPHRLTGLFIEYDEEKERIWFSHEDDGRLGYYDETNIHEIQKKYKLQYYFQADVIAKGGKTFYDFKQVDALVFKIYPLSVKGMYDAAISGEQVLEFRAHLCDDDYCVNAGAKQCLPPGKLRCRGTAFRTPKKMIDQVWYVTKIAPQPRFRQSVLLCLSVVGAILAIF